MTETLNTFPLLSKYMKKIEKQKSIHTARAYEGSLKLFVDYFTIENHQNVAALTRDDFEDFQQYLLNKGLASSSVNAHFRNIKAFVNWLYEGDHIENNPMMKVHSLKEPKKERATISDEEFQAMVRACENLQEKVMIYVMRYALLRREEITNVRKNDFKDGKLLVHGKGNKEVAIPLNDYVAELLSQYLETREDDSEWMFVSQRGGHKITAESVRQRIKKNMERAGFNPERIDEISAHSFRRTGITSLINDEGIDAMVVKDLARHAAIATTQRYIQKTDKAMKRAVESQKVVGD